MWMMDLSREFYEQIGKPALEAAVPVLSGRYAAGLVGYGSECFGFDDEISADHDYGPGFCVWLTKRDYERYGQRLKEVYAGLPDTFLGMKVKKMPERAGIFEIEEFYRMLYIPNTNPQNWMEWLRLPEEKLALATNGQVFEDPLGEFTRIRERLLAGYPRDLRLKKMAMHAGIMGQSGQYNYPRGKKRGETGTSFFALSEFCDSALSLIYLLNNRYWPFYKWKMRGAKELPELSELVPMIGEIMETPLFDARKEEQIEAICIRFADELMARGLSRKSDAFMEVQKAEITKCIEDRDLRML